VWDGDDLIVVIRINNNNNNSNNILMVLDILETVAVEPLQYLRMSK
jgi:hypothetical protein